MATDDSSALNPAKSVSVAANNKPRIRWLPVKNYVIDYSEIHVPADSKIPLELPPPLTTEESTKLHFIR